MLIVQIKIESQIKILIVLRVHRHWKLKGNCSLDFAIGNFLWFSIGIALNITDVGIFFLVYSYNQSHKQVAKNEGIVIFIEWYDDKLPYLKKHFLRGVLQRDIWGRIGILSKPRGGRDFYYYCLVWEWFGKNTKIKLEVHTYCQEGL